MGTGATDQGPIFALTQLGRQMLDPEGAVAEDLNAQMQQIGRGLVQINLRLTRVLEVVEKGGGPSASGDQALEALLDLLDAIERTFDAEYPAPRAPWWARLLGQPAPQARKLSELEALAGLKLARTDSLASRSRGSSPCRRLGLSIPACTLSSTRDPHRRPAKTAAIYTDRS